MYWFYVGAEYWPTELYQCTRCADSATTFFSELPGGLQGDYRFSREHVLPAR
jgi:hypothetical protein